MDRLDPSKKVVRAGRDNLLPERVSKQTNDNGRQVVIEAKDVYSTKQSPNNTKGHELSCLEQRQNIQVPKSSTPTSTSTKEENGGKSVGSNALFVRRLSQSGVSPGSQEFQFVLKGFIPPKEYEVVKPKSQVGKTKHRKISFNDYGRASQTTKRFEDMSLSPRPKRSLDMLNAPTISSINRAVDHRKTENNGKTTQSRRSFPFSNIKEAWQESESSLQESKVERRRHVSLPAPPPGFYLRKKQETFIESFKAEKTNRKDSGNSSSVRSNRKISTVFSPNLYEMKSASLPTGSPRASSANEGETITAHRKVSPEFGDLASFAKGKVEPESFESQPKKESPTLNTELLKIKQISTANGHDLHPNLLLGIKSKQAGSNGELLDDGEHQAAFRARKNFQRIGKAAVAARRFLGIQSRETAGSPKQQHHRGISPLAKSEKPFDQMVEEVKCSYQGLQLGPKSEEEKQFTEPDS